MIAPLLVAVSLFASVQQTDTAKAVITGFVRSESSGAPLQYATVDIIIRGQVFASVQTDPRGFYQLTGIPAGRRLVRFRHPYHASHEIEEVIRAGAHIPLDASLQLVPFQLQSVDVRAAGTPAGTVDTTSLRQGDVGIVATRMMLDGNPGVAEAGLGDIAREVPGYEPPDPSDVLFVRGGAADLKLILLNGAPVYAPFHVGGLINALDTELLRSVDMYLGGAPARYDGGLSYVMDMETRSGRSEETRATMSADLLAGRALLEGPVGDRVTYLAGGRSVHGVGATPFVDDAFPYGYGDAMSRIDVDLGTNRLLSLTGFWNREFVRLDTVGVGPDSEARWGNNAASLRYYGPVGRGSGVFTIALSDFRTRLPLGGHTPLVTEGTSQRIRLAADIGRVLGPGRVDYGFSFDRLHFRNLAWPRGVPDSTDYRKTASGDVAGAYLDGSFEAFDRLRFYAGLRADIFSWDPMPRFAPRFSATLQLNDGASIRLAGGKYRQYVRSPDLSAAVYAATVTDRAPSPALAVANASHLVLTVEQRLAEQFALGLEGYYKRYSDLPTENGEDAEASGIDVWLRRSGGAITGWFGYSHAWVWSTRGNNRPTTPVFAGRHLVSAGVNGPLMGQGIFDVRVAYGAGLPYTAIPEPDVTTPVFGVALRAEPPPPTNTAPSEPYLRLDAQVARTFDAEVRGFAFTITPYIKVLNALDRRDALFYHLDRAAENELRALASLPVLPIVGLEWRRF